MRISPEEAKQSLKQIDRVAATTRTAAAYAGADILFGLWGMAWMAAFVASGVLERTRLCGLIGLVWLIVIPAAVVATLVVTRRYRAPVENTEGKRIGLMWCFVYIYAWCFVAVAYPFLDWKALQAMPGVKCITAINCLIPMFAYVVMGLWLRENYLIVIAILISIVTVAGLLVFSHIFWWWMAVLGGGLFMAAGVYMRLRWRSALRMEQEWEPSHE